MDVPRNPRDRQALEEKIHLLEAENSKLKADLHGSFFDEDPKVFKKATGFRNAVHARAELNLSGCKMELDALSRHHHDADPTLLTEMANLLADFMPDVKEEVKGALADCLGKIEKKDGTVSQRGRSCTVDTEHLFLIPFLYVMGGFYEWMAPLLPGIKISQEHFSRLLSLSLPVVVKNWVPRYYCDRSLPWLRTFCAPHSDEAKEGIDCVLFYDGSKHEIERSQGMREQRHTYNSYTKANIVQFIGVTNANGWFIDSTAFAGGKMKESNMVWTLGLWDRLNTEAAEAGEVFCIKLIVDRGFRDNRDYVEKHQGTESWPWPNLKLQVEVVHHLGTDEESTVAQHPPDEVEKNREIQARRWVNEKAFAYFNIAHFFDRVIRASTLPMIDAIQLLALAVANMKMGISTPESEQYRFGVK